MRESDERSGSLFSYVDLEGRIRRDHPLRVANAALADLTGNLRSSTRRGLADLRLAIVEDYRSLPARKSRRP